MISSNDSTCPCCSGHLKYYDKVPRISRTKGRMIYCVEVRRFKCVQRKAVHRELTEDIFPHKQYEAEIIKGVLEGLITSDTLGYEDYPCEITMKRWIAEKLQFS